jgi:hypothetical protein
MRTSTMIHSGVRRRQLPVSYLPLSMEKELS